jgi:hypothetical protein
MVNTAGHRRRYIVCRNPEEARRRTDWRAWVLKLMEAELEALDPTDPNHPERAEELRNSQLFGGFLRENRAGTLLPDAVKISRDARLDGKCVLATNDDTLSPEEVALSDQAARVAEEFFRQARTMGLRARPMFHWSPRRIEAHVRLCSIFLVVQRYAETRTGRSWDQMRRLLELCKVIQFRVAGRECFKQTHSGEELRELLTRLDVPLEAPLGQVPTI